MLRIVQQTSVAAAKGYYAAGYHAEGGDEVGRWGGLGGTRLGLAGEVTREAFERLCENRHPGTGGRLTPRTKGFRTGFLTFRRGDRVDTISPLFHCAPTRGEPDDQE